MEEEEENLLHFAGSIKCVLELFAKICSVDHL
jgi:hypothetical protein